MTETTIDSRNEHGELTARVTKRPEGEPAPRAPFELLVAPTRDCAVCSAYGQRTLAAGEERDLVAADDGSGPRRTGEPIWTCEACGEELRRYPEA